MDYNFLSNTLLFRGVDAADIETMLPCLNAKTREFQRGEVIHHAGTQIQSMGFVLSGSISIENDDVWGNKSILDRVQPGQVFGETYSCVPNEPLMVSVVAAQPCRVLFLDTSRVIHVCPRACEFHNALIRNLLSISSQKNLNLSRRIFHTSSKSIRGRLLSYLSFQSILNGSRDFHIPFNRQQLADYLSVDRSAMSNELSKMQRDGLLQVNRNHFILTGIDPESEF